MVDIFVVATQMQVMFFTFLVDDRINRDGRLPI